jgi:CRISPR-associated endonuclease/helicase Cas3
MKYIERGKNEMGKLWAKKENSLVPNQEELYLVPHLKAVESVGKLLVSSIGHRVLHSFDLNSNAWRERLRLILPLSCLLHDLGKANDWFQKMIRNARNEKIQQPIRHEFLSVILILRSKNKLQSYVKKRISSLGNENIEHLLNSVYSGILAHHLKLDRDLKIACRGLFGEGGYPTELIAYTNHSDFDELFGEDKPKNDFLFSFLPKHNDLKYKYIKEYTDQFLNLNEEWEGFLDSNCNRDWLIFSTLLKPLVICADVMASALVPDGIQYKEWLTKSLNNFITKTDLENIVKERLKGQSPRKFQIQISESKQRITLVEAGCGSGKTIGAYLWALNNANDYKLFFCYPTTGTATEGYLGYVNDGSFEAELIHSKSEVDLEAIQETGDEEGNDIISDKISALKSYHPKIVICTIDTVLALMKNGRKSILSFPSIANGIFVFDEIHSYTDEMFKVMVSFINLFKNTKFLLMSASLQPERKELLKREYTTLAEIESPHDLMELKRYKFNSIKDTNKLIDDVKQAVKGKKILVVVNTVGRAQRIYQELKNFDYNVKIYHSRYKYKDRVTRHREFMESFADSTTSIIGISTQVAEMSLDIDADLLFTEIAPIPSLIQRLGRLNRRTTPENPLPCRDVFFYKPEEVLPYTDEELKLSEDWIKKIEDLKESSQSDLQKVFLELNTSDQEIYPSIYYEFNQPGFSYTPATEGLRGVSNTVNCIIQSDVSLIQNKQEKFENLIIPMTMSKRIDFKNLSLFKDAFIIPENLIKYDPIEGAQWQN